MSDYPTATVREINGQLVLDDPMALAVIRAIEGRTCEKTLADNAERVAHFKNRILELGKNLSEVAIVIINVDNSVGGPLADILMPDTDWAGIRASGAIPYARGLAAREPLQEFLDFVDKETGKTDAGPRLRQAEGVAVVVFDHEQIEVFVSPLDETNAWVKILVDPPV